MTNEELNTDLYEKMFSEQETYRAWLLAQPPEEILNHTYEYTVREDILMSLADCHRPSQRGDTEVPERTKRAITVKTGWESQAVSLHSRSKRQ